MSDVFNSQIQLPTRPEITLSSLAPTSIASVISTITCSPEPAPTLTAISTISSLTTRTSPPTARYGNRELLPVQTRSLAGARPSLPHQTLRTRVSPENATRATTLKVSASLVSSSTPLTGPSL